MTALDWTHAVRDLPAAGLAVDRRARAEETLAVAKALEIPAVNVLVATYRLTPLGGGRIGFKGHVEAEVTQECVVTLEPVTSRVSVPIDAVFSPQTAATGSDQERSLEDLEQPDEEFIEHGIIDVGRVIMEELTAGLDPYPRIDNARFEWTEDEVEKARSNPFAALARFKKPGDSL